MVPALMCGPIGLLGKGGLRMQCFCFVLRAMKYGQEMASRLWAQFAQHLIANSYTIDRQFRAMFSNVVSNLRIPFILQKYRSTVFFTERVGVVRDWLVGGAPRWKDSKSPYISNLLPDFANATVFICNNNERSNVPVQKRIHHLAIA